METHFSEINDLSLSGIYQIRNLINNHIYIGSAKKFNRRKTVHFSRLRLQKHHSIILQNAYNRDGEENFVFEPLITCQPEMLLFYEQQFIDQWKPEYNILPTAGNQLGNIQSKETIQKRISKTRGKTRTEEQKQRMSIALKGKGLGRHISEETREKLRKANIGKILTEEHKKKISNSHLGVCPSKEELEKRRGRKVSEEVKERLRKLRLGKYHSPETREKMSESQKGKHSKPLCHKLISPNGLIYTIVDRQKFCKEHNLNQSHVGEVDKGILLQHKGWKIFSEII